MESKKHLFKEMLRLLTIAAICLSLSSCANYPITAEEERAAGEEDSSTVTAALDDEKSKEMEKGRVVVKSEVIDNSAVSDKNDLVVKSEVVVKNTATGDGEPEIDFSILDDQGEDVQKPEPSGAEVAKQIPIPSLFQYQNYASISELVMVVCEDAGTVFDNFYGPSIVWVKPFVYLTDRGEKRLTALGATMADQMIAMINNNQLDTALNGQYDQGLKGVLQEIDGYLRLHISGENSEAKRRSYTVNIEMSEALYRALHTSYAAARM